MVSGLEEERISLGAWSLRTSAYILAVRVRRPVSGSGFQKLISDWASTSKSACASSASMAIRNHHARSLLLDRLDKSQRLKDLH